MTKAFTLDEHLEEMRGVADGAGVPFKEVWRLHLLGELTKASCSMIGASGEAIARSGEDQTDDDETESALPRYGTPMHPAEDLRSCLQRLSQLQAILFPGWAATATQKRLRRLGLPDFMRTLGLSSAPSELPYAAQLVEPIADILVSMASHSVQWAVEQLIVPFLQLGWRRASAAYTAASMRALAAILDVDSEFSRSSASRPGMARMQREVPTLLSPYVV